MNSANPGVNIRSEHRIWPPEAIAVNPPLSHYWWARPDTWPDKTDCLPLCFAICCSVSLLHSNPMWVSQKLWFPRWKAFFLLKEKKRVDCRFYYKWVGAVVSKSDTLLASRASKGPTAPSSQLFVVLKQCHTTALKASLLKTTTILCAFLLNCLKDQLVLSNVIAA